MQMQKLTVIINSPVHKVFEYTLDPKNTPKWIDSIVKEEVSEQPVKLDTIYRNTNLYGITKEYEVVDLKKNDYFQLENKKDKYQVRYQYKPLSKDKTELTYIEWNYEYEGNIENPFTQEILDKLKYCIERKTF